MPKNGVAESTVQEGRSPVEQPTLIERAASKLDGLDDGSRPPLRAVAAGTAAPEPAGTAPQPAVIIDLARLHGKGIASPVDSRNVTAEEFRRLKRDILAEVASVADRQAGRNLVMVTSALPDEGKTFVSIGIAMSLALERDQRVLCVDGDLCRPRLDKEMGFKASRGLLDLLLDPSLSIADVLLRTNVEGLDVLPAGRPHELSTELITSRRMLAVLRELSRMYAEGVVLFDSSPVLATNEATALARFMSQVLLVVAAEKTSRASIDAAVEQLSGVKSLKIVLNQVRRRFFQPASYAGYQA
jgi:receptor protein-tyrosine kinase